MLIIGVDFHTHFQQIAMLDTETGEVVERRLDHSNGEAKKFYAELQKPARVGMEVTGYAQWFEAMLAKLGHQPWVGDSPRFERRWCESKKPTCGMLCTSLIYSWQTAFRGYGFLHSGPTAAVPQLAIPPAPKISDNLQSR